MATMNAAANDEFDQLHVLQTQLAAAQADEARTVAELTAYLRRGSRSDSDHKALRDAATAARGRTNDLFKKWQRLVRKLTND